MQISVVTSEQEFLQLQENWNTLYHESSVSFFSSFVWNRIWWKHFGASRQLAVYVARERGEVIAIAPLMHEGSNLMFIGTGLADYGEFLGKPEAFGNILQKIADSSHRLILREVPAQSNTHKEIQKSLKNVGASHTVFFDNTCYLVDASKPVDLKKKDIHRNENFLKRQGELEYKQVKNAEEARNIMQHFFVQHDDVWTRKGMPSNFQLPENQDFLKDLVVAGLNDGVQIHALILEGQMIACDIGFLAGQTYVTYANAYDTQWEHKGPGMVLRRKFIEHYINQNISVDFSRGAEAYKTRFANTERENIGVATFQGTVQAITGKSKYAAREFMMRHPKLHEKILELRTKKRN